MIEFMAATYNEEDQIESLIEHVYPWVEQINICDDGSTDDTIFKIHRYDLLEPMIRIQQIHHTGLPEVVKSKALKMCHPDSWVVMLDCDERIPDDYWPQIVEFCGSPVSEGITHVWFNLHEYMDGHPARSFLKCRLFRAYAAHFSDSVHVSDWFDGAGANFDWVVLHSKTSEKQKRREREYIQTYKQLVADGKMTPERMREVIGYHYFIRE